ncbi:hypothetical protein RFI_28875 [Reticulomyxa filosa]|uniref:Kelch repeat-containing protein n=1 Tax=Reticulomyxa filosa TaxID=46433 RepID=X6M4F3_RETFI|nr:hypothetical protein RFI_28875 [Reticulomyxa filosa]|eukprot:ETO08511.1 hypothetical protein RFI_28875 [Reticulomyxa filosa]
MCEMLLLCQGIVMDIQYNEQNNSFAFKKINMCKDMSKLSDYGGIYVNDSILFFGGGKSDMVLNTVFKLFIKENRWMKFEHTLPLPLERCSVVVNTENTAIHIIGGHNKQRKLTAHLKTDVDTWTKEETEAEKLWMVEENERRNIEETCTQVENMDKNIDIKKLTVAIFFFILSILFFFFKVISNKQTNKKRKMNKR